MKENDHRKPESAASRKFHTAFTDIALLREDIRVLRQLINEHGYRLARLESLLGDDAP